MEVGECLRMEDRFCFLGAQLSPWRWPAFSGSLGEGFIRTHTCAQWTSALWLI